MKFYLSLKSQIILAMLSVSLSSVLVVGAIAFVQGRDAIQARTYEQLVSLRNAKADRVESYFSSLTRQAIAMSETAQIVEALKAFNKAFLELKALNYSTAELEDLCESHGLSLSDTFRIIRNWLIPLLSLSILVSKLWSSFFFLKNY